MISMDYYLLVILSSCSALTAVKNIIASSPSKSFQVLETLTLILLFRTSKVYNTVPVAPFHSAMPPSSLIIVLKQCHTPV